MLLRSGRVALTKGNGTYGVSSSPKTGPRGPNRLETSGLESESHRPGKGNRGPEGGFDR